MPYIPQKQMLLGDIFRAFYSTAVISLGLVDDKGISIA